jgi:hypothetical protein
MCAKSPRPPDPPSSRAAGVDLADRHSNFATNELRRGTIFIKAGLLLDQITDLLLAKGAHLGAIDAPAPVDGPPFPRLEEQALARFWLALTGAHHESDDPLTGTGAIDLPRSRSRERAGAGDCSCRRRSRPTRASAIRRKSASRRC